MDWFLDVILLVACLVVLCVIFYIVDECFITPTATCRTTIEEKYLSPQSLEFSREDLERFPEQAACHLALYFTVKINEDLAEAVVDIPTFYEFENGDPVIAKYGYSRFTKKLIVTHIEHA